MPPAAGILVKDPQVWWEMRFFLLSSLSLLTYNKILSPCLRKLGKLGATLCVGTQLLFSLAMPIWSWQTSGGRDSHPQPYFLTIVWKWSAEFSEDLQTVRWAFYSSPNLMRLIPEPQFCDWRDWYMEETLRIDYHKEGADTAGYSSLGF